MDHKKLEDVLATARRIADYAEGRRARTRAFQEAASAARKGGPSGAAAIAEVERRHPVVEDLSDLVYELEEAIRKYDNGT